MSSRVYRFEILDPGQPGGPRGVYRARDLAFDRNVALYWWEPVEDDLAGSIEKQDRCASGIAASTGTEIFSDGRRLYVAASTEEAGNLALEKLRAEGLFTKEALPKAPSLSSPPPPPPKPRLRRWLLLGLLLAGVIVGVIVWPQRTPARPAIESFTVDRTTIVRGGQVNLRWKIENADHVSLSPRPGRLSATGEPQYQDSPSENTTYELTVSGPNGATSAKVSVTVNDALQPTPDRSRDSSAAKNPPSVVLSPGVRSPEVLSPGTAPTKAPPASPPPPPVPPEIVSFTVEPPGIRPGEQVTLRWNTRGVAEVHIDPIGDAPPQGYTTRNPTVTTTYTLTTPGPGGLSLSHTVRVMMPPPSIVAFAPDRRSIGRCESTVLRWKVDNANKVFIDDGDPLTGNALEVSPLSTKSFVLHAEGPGGATVSRPMIVYVTPAEPDRPPECGEIVWSGLAGSDGQVTLDYSTSNARSIPAARQMSGRLPHARVRVTALDSFAQVTSQPYQSGRAVVSVASQRTGLVTIRLRWTHVR